MYARLRPFIQATLMGLPALKAEGFSPIRLKSARRSSSSSSDTPVVQLQKPILARIYRLTSTPQLAASQRNALPLPHSSTENGHCASVHTARLGVVTSPSRSDGGHAWCASATNPPRPKPATAAMAIAL